MRFQGILFDLDGTLIDTSPLIIRSFQHTFRAAYAQELPESAVCRYFGEPLRKAMEELGRPGDADRLIAIYRAYNLEHHDRLAASFAGVEQTLAALHALGLPMAVVTSKTEATAWRGLRLFGLDGYIRQVVGVEATANHKPHPEPVQKGLAQLGLDAAACLMVGDSPADIASGRAAGLQTAAVSWTLVPWEQVRAARPHYVLQSMSDLYRLVTGETEEAQP